MEHIRKISRFIITVFLIFLINVFTTINALDQLTRMNGQIGFDRIPAPKEDYALGVKHASTGAIIVGEGTSEVVSFIILYNFVAKGKGSENAIQQVHSLWKTNMQFRAADGNPRLHSEISLLQFLTGAENPSRLSGILGEIQRRYPGKNIKILIKNSKLKPCHTKDTLLFGPGIGCYEFIQDFQSRTGINVEVRI
ncbi:MAG: hypothetical protein E7015_00710 [Alphaproteobacteria bacterium]|nr:hypothetical protein [Alphaproteobacteria bacterium]